MINSDFFSGIEQKAISFGDHWGKSPMFIRDANIIGGTFLADYAKVRAKVPNNFKLMRLPFNKTLVGIHCMEYKDTDIGAYNEIAISALIHPPHGFLPGPIKSISSALKMNFHAYILHLPVNTEISVAGGTEIFNFPKVMTDIEIRDTGQHRICTLRDAKTLNMILEVECKTIKTKHHSQTGKFKEVCVRTYIDENNFSKQGILKINQQESGMSFLWPNISLRYGKHAMADQIKELQIGRQLAALFSPHSQAILSLN